MTLSLLSFLTLTASGFGLLRLFSRRINLQFNTPIELGVGFFIAVAVVEMALRLSPLPISQTSHVVFILSCLGASLAVWFWKSEAGDIRPNSTNFFQHPELLNIGILILVSGYLLLVLINNISRDIFPWDAFTTWMYRAKAWVTTDTAVEFLTLKDWVATSAGFTLPAAHYPIGISAIAAFSSALSGDWSGPAASTPWLFATLASAMIMAGLSRLQAPANMTRTLVAVAVLITAPLVHLHGLLAGYADIWVMGTSGMGLAGICLWTQQKSSSTLGLSFVLLALGCLWKTEGWLWLLLGCLMTLTYWLCQRFAIRGLTSLSALAILIGVTQPLDLGPLGVWGISEYGMSAGVLGEFALRPYNPVSDYLEQTLVQGNFLLMLPLYFLALLALSLKSIRSHSGYLVMALALMGIHGLIFGFSEYSQYAEAGTAINRFLLQTLPVLIVTISSGWPIYAAAQYSVKAEHRVRKWQPRLLTALVLLLGTGASLPIALALFSQNPDHISTAVAQSYQPSELRGVLGELEPKDDGYRFKALNVPVGVAAIPLSVTDISQPRYLTIQAWMNEPETLSFYWINSEETGVHSTPISLNGHSLLDMAAYPDYWRQPIREMGFLVQPQYFHDVVIGPLAVTGSLFDALPALLRHWITPAPLSHRLINTTTGHVQTPVTLNSLLVVALAIFFLISVCGRLLIPTQAAAVTRGVTIGIFILWAIGSAAHVSQTLALSKPHLSHTPNSAVAADLSGGHLLELVESISNDSVLSGAPILSLALDDASQLAAQRIPFMLLPLPATVIDTAQLNEIIEEFSGGLLMFAKDESRMRDMADALAGRANLQIRQSGPGYLLLSREAE